MSLYGVIGYHVTLSEGHMIANHPIYGVIGYHVTLLEGHILWQHRFICQKFIQTIYGVICHL